MGTFVRRALVGAAIGLASLAMVVPTLAVQTRSSVGRIVADVTVGGSVFDPIFDGAFGAGALWVSIGGDTIARIDPATNSVVARINVGAGFRHEIAVGSGGVWVTNPDDNTVSRIEPATNTVVATIASNGFLPIGVTTTSGAVWVSNHHADPSDENSTGSVVRIDPATNTVVAVIPIGAPLFEGGPGGMATAGGRVWVAVPNLGGVVAIDPATNDVAAYVAVGPCGIPAGNGAELWVPTNGCSSPSQSIARIDGASGSLDFTANAGGVARFAAGGLGSTWVTVTSASCPPNCPPSSSKLARLDPATGEVLARLPLDGFGFVAPGAGSVWVGVGTTGHILRIDPS